MAKLGYVVCLTDRRENICIFCELKISSIFDSRIREKENKGSGGNFLPFAVNAARKLCERRRQVGSTGTCIGKLFSYFRIQKFARENITYEPHDCFVPEL